MSLRHALLGLLAERSSSGYDLTRRFTEGIGAFAWSARHSQIYPELIKMADDGLVEVVDEGPRGRRTYAITPDGTTALRDWLMGQRDGGGSVRNEFVLRLFLLSTLSPEDARTVLLGVIEHTGRQLDVLAHEQAQMAAAGLPSSTGANLAAAYGVHSYRATQDWARWAMAQLD